MLPVKRSVEGIVEEELPDSRTQWIRRIRVYGMGERK